MCADFGEAVVTAVVVAETARLLEMSAPVMTEENVSMVNGAEMTAVITRTLHVTNRAQIHLLIRQITITHVLPHINVMLLKHVVRTNVNILAMITTAFGVNHNVLKVMKKESVKQETPTVNQNILNVTNVRMTLNVLRILNLINVIAEHVAATASCATRRFARRSLTAAAVKIVSTEKQ